MHVAGILTIVWYHLTHGCHKENANESCHGVQYASCELRLGQPVVSHLMSVNDVNERCRRDAQHGHDGTDDHPPTDNVVVVVEAMIRLQNRKDHRRE